MSRVDLECGILIIKIGKGFFMEGVFNVCWLMGGSVDIVLSSLVVSVDFVVEL